MTVSEMIEMLESMDGDAEVRLGFQPQYPFEPEVGEIVEMGEYGSYCEECEILWDAHDQSECEAERPDPEEEANIVYIGEGGQIGYMPGFARAALGWS